MSRTPGVASAVSPLAALDMKAPLPTRKPNQPTCLWQDDKYRVVRRRVDATMGTEIVVESILPNAMNERVWSPTPVAVLKPSGAEADAAIFHVLDKITSEIEAITSAITIKEKK